jgi:5'-nucleotidase
MEAAIWSLPAMAVSLESPENLAGPVNYHTAALIARVVAQSVLRYGLAPNVLLNVNVPYLPYEQLKGIRITRQGLRVYHDKLDQRLDPRGKPYYWTAGDLPTGVPEHGTDIGMLAEGCVSVTPIQLDLTAYHAIPDLNAWEWEIDNLMGFAASVGADMPILEIQAA